MFCFQCGKKLDEGAVACAHCAAAVPFPRQQDLAAEAVRASEGGALGTSEALRLAWRLFASRFGDFTRLLLALVGVYMLAMFSLVIVVSIVIAAIMIALIKMGMEFSDPSSFQWVLLPIVPIFSVAYIAYVLFGSLAAMRLYWGEKTWGRPWRASMEYSLRNLRAYASAGLLQCLATYGGMVLAGVGIAYTNARYAFAGVAFLDGVTSGPETLNRSLSITRGMSKTWLFVLGLPMFLVVLMSCVQFAGLSPGIQAVIGYVWLAVLFLLIVPLHVCLSVVLYRNRASVPLVPDPKPTRSHFLTGLSVGLGAVVVIAYMLHSGLQIRSVMMQAESKIQKTSQQ